MGGRVSITNKTSFTIRVQLCHLSPLYSKQLCPNEVWSQETGAVHFTIKVDVQEDENQLQYGSETGLTYKDKRILDAQTWGSVEKSFHLSSNGWYFRGDNQLEIIGGPNLTDGEPDFSNLKIIRKEKKEKKQNSLTPKPSRKSNVRRSRSVSTCRNVKIEFERCGSPQEKEQTHDDIVQSEFNPNRIDESEDVNQNSSLDAFFVHLSRGRQPHIKVQRMSSN